MRLSLECLLQQMKNHICYLRGGLCFDLVSLFLGDNQQFPISLVGLALFVVVSTNGEKLAVNRF